eukprot:m.55304 g.55304  ORF g.55304 m.55304 type:complete len:456 (-) comp22050_c0_seq1:134-1501(-)
MTFQRQFCCLALLFASNVYAMNKKELVEGLASTSSMPTETAEIIVDTFISETSSALKKGDRVSLVGFGSFSTSTRAARTGPSPPPPKPTSVKVYPNTGNFGFLEITRGRRGADELNSEVEGDRDMQRRQKGGKKDNKKDEYESGNFGFLEITRGRTRQQDTITINIATPVSCSGGAEPILAILNLPELLQKARLPMSVAVLYEHSVTYGTPLSDKCKLYIETCDTMDDDCDRKSRKACGREKRALERELRDLDNSLSQVLEMEIHTDSAESLGVSDGVCDSLDEEWTTMDVTLTLQVSQLFDFVEATKPESKGAQSWVGRAFLDNLAPQTASKESCLRAVLGSQLGLESLQQKADLDPIEIKELVIKTVTKRSGLPKDEVANALDYILKNAAPSSTNTGRKRGKGDRVSLVGFGSFSISKRAARTGRNPQSGKEIQIPANTVIKFKAGKDLSTTN